MGLLAFGARTTLDQVGEQLPASSIAEPESNRAEISIDFR